LTGTSLRRGVVVDYEPLIDSLVARASEISGLPLLRVNWYDAARNSVPDTDQERIGALPRVKLHLGRLNMNGEQKGVDLRIGLDMVAQARNGAVDVIVVISGDDDRTLAVEEAQTLGVQVLLLAVPDKNGKPEAVSPHLMRAADGVELCDAAAIDRSATRSAAQDMRTVAAAAKAAQRKQPPPKPVPAPAPPLKPAYSSSTGGPTTIAPQYQADYEDKINGVVDRVLSSLEASMDADARREMCDGRPTIPPDVDKALLVDTSHSVGIYDLDDKIRYQVRDRFWKAYDRKFAPSATR
jgi:uncharacterized LabA/DUF88 family protein